MAPKEVYLVIGGSGFVGRHIVQQLLDRGDTVATLDIVQRYHDVPFYSADITDEEQVADALRKTGTTCIIHTASPPATINKPDVFFKVNVDGTKAIIAAAVSTGVRKLVYTSSAGVVFDGGDLIDVDERLEAPEVPLDAYNDSKAKAEAIVLAANGKDGLLTVAIRPAGIFGPGDRQVMSGLYAVYENNQTHFQIGDNTNLFDWTYVGNVARAHILAADKLETPAPSPALSTLEKSPSCVEEVGPMSAAEAKLVKYALPPITLTTGKSRVPTCQARPLGPYVTPPPNAEKLLAAFNDPNAVSERPIIRTRYDQLVDLAIKKAKLHHLEINPLQVAGQAFFVTNGEPCYFWDFPRAVWQQLDGVFPGKRQPRKYFKLSKSVGLMAASGAEWVAWLTGKEPTFTRYKVSYSCVNRWYNIEKARRVLGYEPIVGVEEGVKLMVEVKSPMRCYPPAESNLSDEDNDGDEDEECPSFAFPELDTRIRECVATYEAVFPKLNFSSPKDASWILPASSPLKCTSPSDVYLLLKSSDFITHDLSAENVFAGCDNPPPSYELELVLRKWYAVDRSRELRCFVRHNVLVAISQRDNNYYEFLNDPKTKDFINRVMLEYWEKNIQGSKHWETYPDYTFDFFLTRDLSRGHIIDFNPYAPQTDPLLFTYEELADIVDTSQRATSHNPSPINNSQQLPEFRVIDSRAHPAATSNAPAYQHNMVPIEALSLSSGRDIDEFAELWKDEIQQSMSDCSR
ncbi:hypothetical protein C0991_006387 [Blastosporella zonata]|nr:hypothetical protein C0991_006387 [Blastosporella zonata]